MNIGIGKEAAQFLGIYKSDFPYSACSTIYTIQHTHIWLKILVRGRVWTLYCRGGTSEEIVFMTVCTKCQVSRITSPILEMVRQLQTVMPYKAGPSSAQAD
jgi:hypothetical protein